MTYDLRCYIDLLSSKRENRSTVKLWLWRSNRLYEPLLAD